jgi:hypothetical protein
VQAGECSDEDFGVLGFVILLSGAKADMSKRESAPWVSDEAAN